MGRDADAMTAIATTGVEATVDRTDFATDPSSRLARRRTVPAVPTDAVMMNAVMTMTGVDPGMTTNGVHRVVIARSVP